MERVHLPDLSRNSLDAKIDTGAYTSSLHCHSVEVYSIKGKNRVRFYVLDPSHPEYEGKRFESPVYKVKKIKSSNGIVSERVIIKQKISFGGKISNIQLSLSNRSDMKYPLLIGRRFISGKFLVDVSKKYIYG
ncbi:MAG: RimK/LysX family protein [Candidatus Paceibacterota bacterium]